MSKLYLCGITSAGKEKNLRELIEPIKQYFDGLQWCFHYPTDSGADYLEANKGSGRIVYSHFSGRHGFSQTQYLWQGTMEEGDFFCQVDDSEMLGTQFCQYILPELVEKCKRDDIGMIANYGKGFLYKFHDQLEYRNSPHWTAINVLGKSINIELDLKHFWNARSRDRDKWHFINHYCKYYINYPAGSNHCLLGLEKNGNPEQLFPIRENRRLEFRRYLKSLGLPVDYKAFIEYLKETPELPPKMIEFLQADVILNDAARFYRLGDRSFVDDHSFSKMIPIPAIKNPAI